MILCWSKLNCEGVRDISFFWEKAFKNWWINKLNSLFFWLLVIYPSKPAGYTFSIAIMLGQITFMILKNIHFSKQPHSSCLFNNLWIPPTNSFGTYIIYKYLIKSLSFLIICLTFLRSSGVSTDMLALLIKTVPRFKLLSIALNNSIFSIFSFIEGPREL